MKPDLRSFSKICTEKERKWEERKLEAKGTLLPRRGEWGRLENKANFLLRNNAGKGYRDKREKTESHLKTSWAVSTTKEQE